MICSHFGWTWDFLHHGIEWTIIQRIMTDLPFYESESEDEDVKVNKENATAIANHINSLV